MDTATHSTIRDFRPSPITAIERRRNWAEISIVLLLSLGSSAIYSIISIIYRITREVPLNEQTATINRPLNEQAIFDLIYQILSIGLGLVPVALALYLLIIRPLGINRPLDVIGLNTKKLGSDIGWAFALCAGIGIPGLGLYVIGKHFGITVQIVPTTLDRHWWVVPVLLLAAVKAALVEEVILFGYVFPRLRQLSFHPWAIIIALAVFRGSYHLYQGFGPFIGNVVMGIVFGWLLMRTGRVMPLVYAHFILDAVSFVGYPLVADIMPFL